MQYVALRLELYKTDHINKQIHNSAHETLSASMTERNDRV